MLLIGTLKYKMTFSFIQGVSWLLLSQTEADGLLKCIIVLQNLWVDVSKKLEIVLDMKSHVHTKILMIRGHFQRRGGNIHSHSAEQSHPKAVVYSVRGCNQQHSEVQWVTRQVKITCQTTTPHNLVALWHLCSLLFTLQKMSFLKKHCKVDENHCCMSILKRESLRQL